VVSLNDPLEGRELLIVERKLARLLEELGRTDGTSREDLLRRAWALEVMARRSQLRPAIAMTMSGRAEVLVSMNRHAEAAGVLGQALEELGPEGETAQRIPLLAKRGEAQGRCGDWPAVVRTSGEGIPLVEEARAGIGRAYLQSSFLASSISLYSWGVRAAYELQNADLMLGWAELSKCRSALRYQNRSGPEAPEVTEARHELSAISEAFHDAVSPDERARLGEERQQRWDWLHARRFPRAGQPSPQDLVRALQLVLLPGDAALYYYWLETDHLLIAALDGSRFVPVIRRLEPSEREDLEDFAQYVLQFSDQSSQLRLDDVVDFSDLLLPPEVREILKGARRLRCSPHRLLHAIPFHALLVDGKALIESMAIRYVPNLLTLFPSYEADPAGPLLAAGTCASDLPGIPPLPAAEREVEGVAELYRNRAPVTLLEGEAATRAGLMSLACDDGLARYRCLHFALHGHSIDSDTPMEAHLLLREKKLDGLDISNWRLDADLVVLSACCSGQRAMFRREVREELPGDDLFGLPAAFFAAGARQILSALWPVDDDAAVRIMTAFHRHLAGGGADYETALQHAVLDYRSTVNAAVYFWAPFFLTGLGRPVSGPPN
jgi:CHAT domain-containing protein